MIRVAGYNSISSLFIFITPLQGLLLLWQKYRTNNMNKYELERFSLKAFVIVDNQLQQVIPDRREYLLARRLKTAIMRMVSQGGGYNSLVFNTMRYKVSRYKGGYWETVSFDGKELEYEEIRIAFVCALQLMFGEFPQMSVSWEKTAVRWSMPSGRCVRDVLDGSVNRG